MYYTEVNLDKLKLKEPEKSYELTNFDLNVSIDGILTNFSFKVKLFTRLYLFIIKIFFQVI